LFLSSIIERTKGGDLVGDRMTYKVGDLVEYMHANIPFLVVIEANENYFVVACTLTGKSWGYAYSEMKKTFRKL